MRGLVITLYVAVFLALYGLDYGIGRYYSAVTPELQVQPYPGYRAALKVAAGHVSMLPEDGMQRAGYLADSDLNLSLEPVSAMPLPPSLMASRDLGEVIMLESDSSISLYQKVGDSDWLLRLDMKPPVVSQRTRYGLTVLFYSGVAAILLLWITPLLRGVRQLNRAAKKMGEGQLDTRVVSNYGDYLKPLKTEFNLMAEKLQRLDENNQLLTQAVSHELRTPLARMRFGLDLLQSRRNAAQREEDVQRIERDIDAMEYLVRELLQYARLDTAPKLNRQSVDVPALIEERIQLRVDAPCDIEYESHGLLSAVVLDPEQLIKVLDNLLQNACRHARDKVRVRCESLAGEWVLWVEDDGTGVAEDRRELIFQPFSQLARVGEIQKNPVAGDVNQGFGQGFGLGLAIVARIVHWHGGRVEVTHSQHLGGAAFGVYWPR